MFVYLFVFRGVFTNVYGYINSTSTCQMKNLKKYIIWRRSSIFRFLLLDPNSTVRHGIVLVTSNCHCHNWNYHFCSSCLYSFSESNGSVEIGPMNKNRIRKWREDVVLKLIDAIFLKTRNIYVIYDNFFLINILYSSYETHEQ